LDGLECFHTKHSTSMTEHYLELTEKHDLLVTGGSDCHGKNHGRPMIGTIKIPYNYVEKLKDAVLQRAAENGFLIAHDSNASATSSLKT
jgi:3',5'-nucleoside bisphosphate phosphatase